MHFRDTPEEAAFRQEVRAWLVTHAAPRSGPLGALHGTRLRGAEDLPAARRLQRRLIADHLAGITWPVAWGGRDGTLTEQIIFNQEAAAFDMPTEVLTVGINLAGPTIISHGTEEQRRRLLPALLCGDEVWCQLFSEPGAGSDLASVQASAARHGDDWLVNGQKVWTSGAHYADRGMLLTRTDADRPKHEGITYFTLDMRSPGVEVRPLRQMTGESHFNEVFLDNVRIPDEDRLGPINDGWSVARTTLASERLTAGGGDLVADPGSVIALARAFGTTGDPRVRQCLADIYIRSRIKALVVDRMVTGLAQGRSSGPEASVAKLCFSELARRVGDLTMEMMGAAGLVADSDAAFDGVWLTNFLTGPGLRLGGGTDEIQRSILAERVLGLPR